MAESTHPYHGLTFTTDPTTESVEETQTDIASYVLTYGRPLIWVLGTIGNSLSLAVFCRPKMRSSLTGFLFLWLAVFDLIVVQDHFQSILIHADIDVMSLHDWTCRSLIWFMTSAKFAAVWMLVGVGLERLIGVMWPHRAKYMCTLRRGKYYLLCVVLLSSLANVPYLLATIKFGYFEQSLGKDVYWCIVDESHVLAQYMLVGKPWMELAVYSILPWVGLFVINIVIIIKLVLHGIKIQRMQEGESSTSGSNSKIQSMTVMLVTVSIAFLILTAPLCLSNILQMWSFWKIGFFLQGLNHSINFILYCMTGNKFRQELKNLFCNK